MFFLYQQEVEESSDAQYTKRVCWKIGAWKSWNSTMSGEFRATDSGPVAAHSTRTLPIVSSAGTNTNPFYFKELLHQPFQFPFRFDPRIPFPGFHNNIFRPQNYTFPSSGPTETTNSNEIESEPSSSSGPHMPNLGNPTLQNFKQEPSDCEPMPYASNVNTLSAVYPATNEFVPVSSAVSEAASRLTWINNYLADSGHVKNMIMPTQLSKQFPSPSSSHNIHTLLTADPRPHLVTTPKLAKVECDDNQESCNISEQRLPSETDNSSLSAGTSETNEESFKIKISNFNAVASPENAIDSPELEDTACSNGTINVKKESELLILPKDGNIDNNHDGFSSETLEDSQNDIFDENRSETNVDNDNSEINETMNFMESKNVMSCSLCDFETDLTNDYDHHVKTNHGTVCISCKFVADDLNQLFLHRQSCPSVGSKLQSPNLRQKLKAKKLTCKVCQNVAKNEVDFYQHRSTHISADKILRCTYCCFVTQYKHHLDYHLKNHTGNKPFKCDLCDYSCVNKSMLNSHKKSHSNFYSYKCKDCNYEAKYMHALKCHCRKYKHAALPVMNPDGSMNPFPIVDIYGTRRGPKIKRDSQGNPVYPSHYTAKVAMQATSEPTPGSNVAPPAGSSVSPTGSSFSYPSSPFFRPHETPQSSSSGQFFNGLNLNMFRNNSTPFNTPPGLPSHQLSYLNSPLTPNPREFLENLKKTQLISPINNFNTLELKPPAIKCQFCNFTASDSAGLQSHILIAHVLPRMSRNVDSETPTRAPPVSRRLTENANTEAWNQYLRSLQPDNNSRSSLLNVDSNSISKQQSEIMDSPVLALVTPANLSGDQSPTPLDLTKDHTPPQQIIRRRLSDSSLDVSPSSLTPPDTCSPPKKIRRDDIMSANRRLENLTQINESSMLQDETSNEMDTSDDAPISQTYELQVTESKPECKHVVLDCSFCRITFGFEDMYNKHMEFHDENDKLKCSFCEKKYNDFSAFFDHCYSCKSRQSCQKN